SGSTGREGPPGRVVPGGVEGVDVLDQGAAPDLAQLDAAAGRALVAQDAQVLLGAQQLEGLVLVRRGQDHLGDHGLDLPGHGQGDRTVGGDHRAVGGDRIGGVGTGMGGGDVLALGGHRDAAGVVVLHDDHGGPFVVEGGAGGGVGIDVVVVAHLLAAELLG